jgi:hypothetical protein
MNTMNVKAPERLATKRGGRIKLAGFLSKIKRL